MIHGVNDHLYLDMLFLQPAVMYCGVLEIPSTAALRGK